VLITILSDENLRWDRNATACFVTQFCCAFAKTGAACAQRFFENDAVFGFGAAAMLRRTAFEGLDHILWNIADQ
jgi:hypothetical protein